MSFLSRSEKKNKLTTYGFFLDNLNFSEGTLLNLRYDFDVKLFVVGVVVTFSEFVKNQQSVGKNVAAVEVKNGLFVRPSVGVTGRFLRFWCGNQTKCLDYYQEVAVFDSCSADQRK